MGIRETLNRHPRIAFGIMAAVALAAAGYAYLGTQETAYNPEPQMFYSNDDGKTWFRDNAFLPVPTERDGKQVVRARVATDGSTERVCYLERFNAKAHDRLAREVTKAQQEGRPASAAFGSSGLGLTSIEVKAPGGDRWIPITSGEQASKVLGQLQTANGAKLEMVQP
jgi:hypothetical protein